MLYHPNQELNLLQALVLLDELYYGDFSLAKDLFLCGKIQRRVNRMGKYELQLFNQADKLWKD
jgi:hypothetical protein